MFRIISLITLVTIVVFSSVAAVPKGATSGCNCSARSDDQVTKNLKL